MHRGWGGNRDVCPFTIVVRSAHNRRECAGGGDAPAVKPSTSDTDLFRVWATGTAH